MKRNKVLYWLFLSLTLLLSHAVCALIGHDYAAQLCAGAHLGASAPAYIAFFWLIPFGIGIAVCGSLAALFYSKLRKPR